MNVSSFAEIFVFFQLSTIEMTLIGKKKKKKKKKKKSNNDNDNNNDDKLINFFFSLLHIYFTHLCIYELVGKVN